MENIKIFQHQQKMVTHLMDGILITILLQIKLKTQQIYHNYQITQYIPNGRLITTQ